MTRLSPSDGSVPHATLFIELTIIPSGEGSVSRIIRVLKRIGVSRYFYDERHIRIKFLYSINRGGEILGLLKKLVSDLSLYEYMVCMYFSAKIRDIEVNWDVFSRKMLRAGRLRGGFRGVVSIGDRLYVVDYDSSRKLVALRPLYSSSVGSLDLMMIPQSLHVYCTRSLLDIVSLIEDMVKDIGYIFKLIRG